MAAEPTEQRKLEKKILLGPAILRPLPDDREHFGLYRPLIVRGWDEELGAIAQMEMGKELGPLMVYRRAARDEEDRFRSAPPGTYPPDMHVMTTDPLTNRPVLLFKVYDARTLPEDVQQDILRENDR